VHSGKRHCTGDLGRILAGGWLRHVRTRQLRGDGPGRGRFSSGPDDQSERQLRSRPPRSERGELGDDRADQHHDHPVHDDLDATEPQQWLAARGGTLSVCSQRLGCGGGLHLRLRDAPGRRHGVGVRGAGPVDQGRGSRADAAPGGRKPLHGDQRRLGVQGEHGDLRDGGGRAVGVGERRAVTTDRAWLHSRLQLPDTLLPVGRRPGGNQRRRDDCRRRPVKHDTGIFPAVSRGERNELGELL